MRLSQKRFKRFFHKLLKLKSLSIIALLLAGGVASIVFYYHLDPGLMTRLSFYANLANPSVRIVRVQEGLRKEEIAEILADKLNWDEAEAHEFLNARLAMNTAPQEGRYFPKTYLLHKDTGPVEASAAMQGEFFRQVDKIKKPASREIISEDVIVKIASIIQREAGGKSDMRLISGVIWNRIFKDMKLQMDATLQYAKGNSEEGWWPKVIPEDKKIKSVYNTYLHEGLPPGAIANPGADAIRAAYNPQKTNCMFYLHDRNRKIHCSKTYEEHKKNIEKYFK